LPRPKEECNIYFEDQTIFIHVSNNKIRVNLLDADATTEHIENSKDCITLDIPEDYFSKDHDKYLFFSADTHDRIPNEHVLHEVRFINRAYQKGIFGEDFKFPPQPKKAFSGKANDLLR
jgi:hypothetical protein